MSSTIRSFYYLSGAGGDANKTPSSISVDFRWPGISTTDLALSPANGSLLGDAVTLSATVTAGVEGTVEFFTTPSASGVERSLGSAPVLDGVATVSTATLGAGGHLFRAALTPSNLYGGSQAIAPTVYSVVDPSQPPVCSPAADADVLSSVTARWAWSNHSIAADKVAGGDVSLAPDGETFVLSGGVARVSAGCTSIAFQGTARVEDNAIGSAAYGTWVELVDPILVIDEAGNGAWTARVRSGTGALNTVTSDRMVIATLSGATGLIDFTDDVIHSSINLDYTGTTAPGTWAATPVTSYKDAWSNAFILALPVSLRTTYFANGDATDSDKAPSAVQIEWSWAIARGEDGMTITINGQQGNVSVAQGQAITFEARPFVDCGAPVEIEVHSTVVQLAPVMSDALTGIARTTWTVPATFEPGTHTVIFTQGALEARATFTVTGVSADRLSDTGAPESAPLILATGAFLALAGLAVLLAVRLRGVSAT